MATIQNIIIIEDNETFSLLVTHYLKTNLGNAKVYVENSGARAIERIKELKPSLVILDYYLENELSAKDVMHVINAMQRRPKVILLSSIKDESERKEVMEMGIDRFVPKSNESLYELLQIIEQMLDAYGEPSTEEKKGLSSRAMIGVAAIAVIVILAIVFLMM